LATAVWCGDCTGYTGVVADAASRLFEVLVEIEFAETAQAVFPDPLAGYDRFVEMLEFRTDLRCPAVCRTGRPNVSTISCEVRTCARDRRLDGCLDCSELEHCDLLRNLHDGLHLEQALRNARRIREEGLREWLRQRS